MKKRILALALAATTAFSMLGSGLSASAAGIDKWTTGDISNYAPKTLTVDYKAAVDEVSDAEAVFKYGGEEIDITDFVLATTYEDAVDYEVTNEVPYLYDYIDNDKVMWADVEDAVNEGDAVALAKLLGITTTGDNQTVSLRTTATSGYSFRAILEKKFAEFKGAMVDVALVEDDEYGFDVLISDIKRADNSFASSQLIAYIQQYNTYIEYANLPDLNAQIDAVQAKIDALAMRGEDEFKTATQYKYFAADLEDLQEALDDADTYAKVATVNNDVDELADKYTSAGADKTELKELLLSLYEDQTINWIKTHKDYPTAGNDGAVINSKDYDTNSDAWKAFTAAYTNAVTMYNKLSSKSFQTDVNNMVAVLTDAIDGLSSNTTVPNWLLVKIEENLAKAYALESTDYKKAVWEELEKAVAKAEAVLEAAKPGLTTATKASDDLEDALAKIAKTTSLQAITASEKNALKKTIETAEKTLKGLDKASNGAQYYALTAAINDAKALYKNNTVADGLKDTTSKSMVAKAIDALNAAIDFSEVVIGWNQLANGTWMYGTEDGYVTSAWKWIGSAWYYFDANGIMATGWLQLDGAWYYMYSWGGMAKGWAQVNGTWYYLNPNGGKMLANGWNWIDGKCYYFYSWGGMAANTTIDGYKVDASGAWVK